MNADALCQVCGEIGGDEYVGCHECSTLHHLACWNYLGHCSVYACGSRTAVDGAGELLEEPEPEADRPQLLRDGECESCKRRWKLEKGYRCHGCGRTYHGSCWAANGGCLQFECRGGRERGGGHSVVSGLGRANCRICSLDASEGGPLVICSSCEARYHLDCWRPNGGCVRADCRPTTPPAPAKLPDLPGRHFLQAPPKSWRSRPVAPRAPVERWAARLARLPSERRRRKPGTADVVVSLMILVAWVVMALLR